MAVSGETIRMMNYVDDISATLRRIVASVPTMTGEERKRISDYIRSSQPNLNSVLEMLDKGAK